MATEQQVINFINKIAPMCMEDMKKSKVLASLKIAQACAESAYGQSTATIKGNNLYGIKADKYWKGEFVTAMGWEEINGIKQPKELMRWRKYSSWQESIIDHSNFLKAKRYANIIGCTDYKQACNNVQADGYATAPNYADSLIKLIEQYKLYQYDVSQSPARPQYEITFRCGTETECKTIQNAVYAHVGKYNGSVQGVK